MCTAQPRSSSVPFPDRVLDCPVVTRGRGEVWIYSICNFALQTSLLLIQPSANIQNGSSLHGWRVFHQPSPAVPDLVPAMHSACQGMQREYGYRISFCRNPDITFIVLVLLWSRVSMCRVLRELWVNYCSAAQQEQEHE